jgi:hypothetical protein
MDHQAVKQPFSALSTNVPASTNQIAQISTTNNEQQRPTSSFRPTQLPLTRGVSPTDGARSLTRDANKVQANANFNTGLRSYAYANPQTTENKPLIQLQECKRINEVGPLKDNKENRYSAALP